MDSRKRASSSRSRRKIKQTMPDGQTELLQNAKGKVGESMEKSAELLSANKCKAQNHKLAKRNEIKKSKYRCQSKSKYKSKSNSKSNSHNKHKRKHYTDSSKESISNSKVSIDSQSKSKRKAKKLRKPRDSSSSSSSSSSESSSSDLSSKQSEVEKGIKVPKVKLPPPQRESWMAQPLAIKTFTQERIQKPFNQQQQQQYEVYDPKNNSRELNPYWKSTGTGLPTFLKPPTVEDECQPTQKQYPKYFTTTQSSTNSWRKQTATNAGGFTQTPSYNAKQLQIKSEEHSQQHSATCLTDQQMNELAAKILKAEIMNDHKLATELKVKLENARSQRKLANQSLSRTTEQHVLLAHTDSKGHTRPLPQSIQQSLPTYNPYDRRNAGRKRKQIPTHENGVRQRYFADDDKYDLKQLFEKEKCTSALENNIQFANIVGKQKNCKDDLDDTFLENISKEDTNRLVNTCVQKAVRTHQQLENVLDNCDKCFDSPKMRNDLVIAMGKSIYLALPWYVGLQTGHCILTTQQHSICCTQLDEDVWQEITEFRQSLTKMFAAQRKEVIFFEIANKLHRKSHLTIHCIPVKESDVELAPLYFKKAIDESEMEWSNNKQLIMLRDRPLINCIPKGLPYFWVNFGMQTGFAHVIEDENRFPSNFAQEIIAGILNLDDMKWRKQRKDDEIKMKVKIFTENWKKYDCIK